jgi:hypothetical protein
MVLAAVFGGIIFALSLLAAISGWLLILTLPAIGLAGWSSLQWWESPEKAPTEFKWISAGTIVLSGLWVALYFLIFHILLIR